MAVQTNALHDDNNDGGGDDDDDNNNNDMMVAVMMMTFVMLFPWKPDNLKIGRWSSYICVSEMSWRQEEERMKEGMILKADNQKEWANK